MELTKDKMRLWLVFVLYLVTFTGCSCPDKQTNSITIEQRAATLELLLSNPHGYRMIEIQRQKQEYEQKQRR